MTHPSLSAATPAAVDHGVLPESVATVIAAIETDIIRGRILPRTRLIEDHLMEDYAAKRHVVRAALLELQRLGVVVKPRYRGAELRRFDAQDLRNLYAMRAVLHLTAVRGFTFPIAPHRLDELKAALEAHAVAAANMDLISIHRSNMNFHRVFFGLCDNPYVADSIRFHDWLSFPARAYGAADVGALQQACEEHAAITSAVSMGDRPALERVCVLHMERARRIYEEKFLSR
jgi:DNA-binding GntR family transcriptional regulator